MIYRSLVSWVLASLILAVSTLSAQEPENVRGQQLLLPYKKALQETLRAGLSEGAVEAIAACQVQAPAIASAFSQEGVVVGRASHRLRNPDNAAPDWVEPILAAYIANPADREPQSVRLPSDQLGYAEPIVLQPLCETCHGNAIAEAVETRISELYPEDRAVGFNAGDLRGVFWAKYPAAKQLQH